MFSKELNQKLDRYHLLKHPFYQIFWNEGKLTREIIKDYAEQYYQHVKAFPRYISATHSICDDIEKRKILLENLQDEENVNGDHPKLWKNFAKAMGSDVKKIDDDYIVFTHGGRTQTNLKAFDWCLDCQQRGAGEILLTSMDKDGTKDGFDIDILSKISKNVNIPVIASGGAGNLEHLYQAIVKGNADAVLAASIFHFGEYTINQAKEYLKAKGILVR